MGTPPSFSEGNLTRSGNLGNEGAMTGAGPSFAEGNRSMSWSAGSGTGMTGFPGGAESLYDCAGSA
jgi:hypothetical protein